MTDCELLELAAKAARHRIVEWVQDGNGVDVAIIIRADGDGFSKRPWQPLHENQMTDSDGDALRLAVKLGICLGPNFDGDLAVCFSGDGNNITEPYKKDPLAATRRAIVRAAAQIGRSMK